MHRYKIIIQYDGSSFSGWQIQKNKNTVQGEIENALKIISGSKDRIAVHGAGRTDSGVHAYGQVAHFDLNTNLKSFDLLMLLILIHHKIVKLCLLKKLIVILNHALMQ